MAPFDPRRLLSKAMSLPTGVAEKHLPLAVSERIGNLRGVTLERTLRERTVLITGASSGIGAAAAVQIGSAGGKVLLVARSEDKLADVAARVSEHGGRAVVHRADLSSAEGVEQLTAEVLARHGHVDILVNNAGRSIRRSIKHSYDRIHDFERTIDLNYLAPVRLVLAFLPEMRDRGFGHIINVSTAGVQVRAPRFAAYTASKSALDAFSDCAAAELVGDGIRFTTISMPLVRTPMIEPTTMYADFPALTPEQAAERICKAILYRPRKIGTPFGALVGTIEAIDPVAMEAVRARGYRMFPESGGSTPGEVEDAGSDPAPDAGGEVEDAGQPAE